MSILAPATPVMSDQSGVLTTAQAVDVVGEAKLRAEVRAGRWRPVGRGLVVTHNGPLTESQRRWAALLSAPRGSVLGGLTALREDGYVGWEDATERPRVVQPMGSRRSAHRDVVTHWSTRLDERDVQPVLSPPRTRPARSVLDEASWSVRPRRARAIVLSAAQQGLAPARKMREALTRRGRCRHRRLIVESLLDVAGGIQSLPETDFDGIRAAIGAPPPTRQSKVRRTDGRFYLDAEWQTLGVACEVHGVPHLAVEQWDADLMRANEIQIRGPRLLVFSSYAIRHQRDLVASQLIRMLRSVGWRG